VNAPSDYTPLLGLLKSLAHETPFGAGDAVAFNSPSFRHSLTDNGLASLVYPLLGEARGQLNADAEEFFLKSYQDALMHKDLAVHILRDMRSRMTRHGRIVLLQGLALAEQVYAEPLCRQMSDIDVHVPDGNAEDVRTCLKEYGFEKFRNYRNVWYRKGMCIDLHESLWGEDRIPCRKWLAPHLELEVVPSAQVPGYYVLSPQLSALQNLFHGLKHGFGRAVWVLDTLMMWRKGYLDSALRQRSRSKIALAGVRYLRDRGLVEQDAPAQQAAKGKRLWWRVERTVLMHGRREGAGEFALAFLCPSLWQSFAYLMCAAFPPQHVLEEMYGREHKAVLPIVRVWVLFKLLVRALT
jgi:hypothetical protein